MTPEEREDLIRAIAEAVHEGIAPSVLSADEARWVKMAIQREAERAALRRAVITKSLAGLVWAAIVALAALAWNDFLRVVRG